MDQGGDAGLVLALKLPHKCSGDNAPKIGARVFTEILDGAETKVLVGGSEHLR